MSAAEAQAVSLGCRNMRRAFHSGFSVEVPALEVPAGRTLALLGPSGSGKSTLLYVLGLLERADAGEVLFDGRPVGYHDKRARMQMAAVFQRAFLLKGSVADNVAYGLRIRGVRGRKARERVERALRRVGLEGYADRSAVTLSGGEAQRVALARALALEPRVLLLDEPLSSLDQLLKRRLSQEFARILRDAGTTTVYVTHDQDEAQIVADRIAIMREGRIVVEGEPDQVVSIPPDDWVARFLGVEPSIRGFVHEARDGLLTVACDGIEIAAVGEAREGDEVLLGIRPEDVILSPAGEPIAPSTARNHIPGVIESMEPRGATWRVTIVAGTSRIAASVSRAGAAEFGLKKGVRVIAIFKATAVRVRRVSEVPVSG